MRLTQALRRAVHKEWFWNSRPFANRFDEARDWRAGTRLTQALRRAVHKEWFWNSRPFANRFDEARDWRAGTAGGAALIAFAGSSLHLPAQGAPLRMPYSGSRREARRGATPAVAIRPQLFGLTSLRHYMVSVPTGAPAMPRSACNPCLITLSRLATALLLLAFAFVRPVLAAEERCVSSSSGLLNAILLAQETDVTVRVVQGNYPLDVNPLDQIDDPAFGYNLTIIGGYNDGCTSRVLDPHLTTIGGDADILELQSYDSITIESIRFAHLAGGIYIEAASYGGNGPDEKVTLRRVIFDDLCTSGSCGGTTGAAEIDSDDVSMSHVMAIHNAHSSCALYVDNHDLNAVSLSYSVIADNAGDGLCITRTQAADDDYELFVQNSIFRDNAGGQDIRTRVSPYLNLRNNIFHALEASPAPYILPVSTLDVDPQFIAPDSGNYHLLTSSPAINSGTALPLDPISQDLDGGPRQIGSAPDRGVYETNVDDSNVITVTSTVDQLFPLVSGSLRWAIIQANADSGLNHIRFNIPGGCPRIITLAAPLPTITDRVIIEGYTQPGSAPNTSFYGFNADICIGIRGNLSADFAFRIPSSVGASHYLQLSGVAIGGFDVAAVDLQGGAGSWIHGVQFAGSLGSTALGNSAVNVRIAGSTTYYNLIGGEERADVNVIANAWTAGVLLLASHANGSTVQNNLIGTKASGLSAAPNQVGIQIAGSHHTIHDNLISGNQTVGIELVGASALDNFITDNRIGLRSLILCTPVCETDLPNISHGVYTHGGAHDNTINSNSIAWNGGAGVRLADGQRNSLLSNRIFDNEQLGIDIDDAGVDAIDNDTAAGAATRANRGLNYPVLWSAEGGAQRGNLRTVLLSTNGVYIVQVFSGASCDASGYGQGKTYVTSAITTIENADSNSNGSVVVDIPLSGTLVGRKFTLVARDAQGNTSEFSPCVPYTCDTIFAYGQDGTSALSCPAQ